jgi:hypothetical protein
VRIEASFMEKLRGGIPGVLNGDGAFLATVQSQKKD